MKKQNHPTNWLKFDKKQNKDRDTQMKSDLALLTFLAPLSNSYIFSVASQKA